MNATDKLVQYIRAHGHDAHANPDGTIAALATWSNPDGSMGRAWCTVQPRVGVVRRWLGY